MKLKLTFIFFLCFALLFFSFGLFGNKGLIQNNKTEQQNIQIENRISKLYGETALEQIQQKFAKSQSLSSNFQNRSNPLDKSYFPKIITASLLIMFLLVLFALIKNRNTNPPVKTTKSRVSEKIVSCPIYKLNKKKSISKIIEMLKNDKILIIPCDTIYGIVGKATNENKLKIQNIKKRDENKNLIILCNKDNAMEILENRCPKAIYNLWPAPLSVIAKDREYESVCIRVPDNSLLEEIIRETGPIFSTSVNISGYPALNDIETIKENFSSSVDAIGYTNKKIPNTPSTIIDITSYPFKMIREGVVKKDEINNALEKSGLTII